MIKLIILILLVILLTSVFFKREKFIVNPNKHVPNFLNIQRHFRKDCKRGFFSCVKSNPYKQVYPYNRQYKDKKYVSYRNTQLNRHLLPIEVNK